MTSLRTRWERAGLRVRILTVTLLAAIVTVTTALAAYAVVLDRIAYDTALTAATDRAGQVSSLVLGQGDDVTKALQEVPSQGVVLQVVDPAGRVLADSDPSAADLPLTGLRPAPGQTVHAQVTGVPADADAWYALVATGIRRPAGGGAAVLVAAAPMQADTRLVKGATVALALLGIVMVGALLWLIDRVLGRALGRVEEIRSSVAAIRATGRGARVPVPGGDDEITRLAQTMNELLDRLERADSAQRAFVGDASHELRSPLATIRTIGETSPGGIDAEGAHVIAAEAVRMQVLVDDLLTLAKADDHGLDLAQVDVDVDELLGEEVRRLRATTSLTIVADIDAARVTGDPRRLAQVLHNLVDNASRHARSTIRLTCRHDALGVVVTVDDDGDGIPPEQRERVFDRFTRLQQSRDRDSGGSGLGLAIVRAVVEAHGGGVAATEAPDGWCRFVVTLPVTGSESA